ncbi:hypothetical protein CR513_28374, partial [Mucuna pruriens]
MIRIFGNAVATKSFTGAFRTPRSAQSSTFPSWTNSNIPEGTRLWVLLAHHFSRRPPIPLDLRIMLKSRDGHEPPA